MVDSYDYIIQTLGVLDIPHARINFRVTEGENYPDEYLVYSLVAANSERYYSNDPTWRNSLYRVTLYTKKLERLQPISEQIRELMRNAGFFFVRFSPDIPHNSGHFSRSADFRIYHKEDN